MKFKSIVKSALVGAVCLVMAGCAAASADFVPYKEIDETIVKDGYYTTDVDESYIHVENGTIELCNFSEENELEAIEGYWNEYLEGLSDEEKELRLGDHDGYVANSLEGAKETYAKQEYTPMTFYVNAYLTVRMLLLDAFDPEGETGSYHGYLVNDDGCIYLNPEKLYSFAGEEI